MVSGKEAIPAGPGPLLFFEAGGSLWAAPYEDIAQVAGADWRAGSLLDLATLLGRPCGRASRVIVVRTERGEWGFAVASIPCQSECREFVLLPAWVGEMLRPCVVSGFHWDGRSLTAVLDLERLTELAAGQAPPAPAAGKPKRERRSPPGGRPT